MSVKTGFTVYVYDTFIDVQFWLASSLEEIGCSEVVPLVLVAWFESVRIPQQYGCWGHFCLFGSVT